MTLRDAIAEDATAVFLNTDEFAESVTYWPRGSATGRSITAVVERLPRTTVTEDGGEAVLQSWEVRVANDSTYGIAGTELNLGGDEIELPPMDGKAAERKTILRIIEQDSGMLVVECR